MLKLKLYTFAMLCKEPTCWKNTRILGKIEGRRKKGTTENEIVVWHH